MRMNINTARGLSDMIGLGWEDGTHEPVPGEPEHRAYTVAFDDLKLEHHIHQWHMPITRERVQQLGFQPHPEAAMIYCRGDISVLFLGEYSHRVWIRKMKCPFEDVFEMKGIDTMGRLVRLMQDMRGE